MPSTTISPIRTIIEIAKHHPSSALAVETHRSYPIPLLSSSSELKIIFLFSISRLVARDGLYLLAPNYRAVIDGKSVKFDELKAVTPADLGVHDVPEKILGKYRVSVHATAAKGTGGSAKVGSREGGAVPLRAAVQAAVR